MHFFGRLSILALVAFIPVVLAAKKQDHTFAGKCDICHLSSAPDKRPSIKEIDSLCAGCHKQTGASHPSGIKPSGPLPQGFPLDSTGKMTCYTCHDIHNNNPALLRGGKTGKAFCSICHRELDAMHKISITPPHTRERGDFGMRNSGANDISGQLDQLSKECLSCHDGSLAVMADVSFKTGDRNVSHPIGIDYLEAYGRSGGKLRHPSAVSNTIRFFNGTVGCGTCHSIFAKGKFKLTLSNKASALCFACHNL